MDRRDFVKRLSTGLGASLTPGVLAAILSGCRAEEDFTGVLADSERQVLGDLAEAIIPRTDTPGALDAGVPQYIEMILTEFTPADDARTLRSQLQWVSSWLDEQNARTLGDVSEEERIQLLEALDDQAFGSGSSTELPLGDPALFAIIKPLTVAGYYTSDAGARQELHQPPFGPYRGDIDFADVGKSWS